MSEDNNPSKQTNSRNAADAYVAEQGIEHSGGIIEQAFEAGWAALRSQNELDEMVASAIEAAIETSPEFNHGWRVMPDKELIPEILDEIPIEYTEKDVADSIYRYKVRRLTGELVND